MANILLHGTLHATIFEVDGIHTDGGHNIFSKVRCIYLHFSLQGFYIIHIISLDLIESIIAICMIEHLNLFTTSLVFVFCTYFYAHMGF